MEINETKPNIMTNSERHFNLGITILEKIKTLEIKINDKPLKIVVQFKYLGIIIDKTGSTSDILYYIAGYNQNSIDDHRGN